MITVTKTFLPPLNEYTALVEKIWKNEWLTNRGEIVLELEEKIKKLLDIENILITNNGTIPIQIALKLLGKNGEIITTPFSYVATSSSILWENCKPVFVDIHPDYLTIDETRIEESITENTTCILATHVFGNPCNIEVIEKIAQKHQLSVIYDAAHCFGVSYKNKSIFNYGDISTCSFHATKLFHTAEGGALFCNDKELFDKAYYSHNFGHNGPLEFHGLGINGKISELQAAMGLAVLPYINEIIKKRKTQVELYQKHLTKSTYRIMKIRNDTNWNYSYFPIIFKSEFELLKVQNKLNENEIYPRRYFYPSLNTIPFIGDNSKMIVSESIASSIMCLPLYHALDYDDIKKISDLINSIC